MALKFELNQNEFDNLSSEMQGHYQPTDNGYGLDVDGQSEGSIVNLKSALQKERSDRENFQSKVSELDLAMNSVSEELQRLRESEANTELRKSVLAVVPETVRHEAKDDILLLAKSELITVDRDGTTVLESRDGKSCDDWLKAVLETKPHWQKPSVGGGERGSSQIQNMRPEKPSSLQGLMDEIFPSQ